LDPASLQTLAVVPLGGDTQARGLG
jgi:hypothetical protein